MTVRDIVYYVKHGQLKEANRPKTDWMLKGLQQPLVAVGERKG